MPAANVYVAGNFKGGVGKTTTIQMLGFENSQQRDNRRTLVIDMDPQGNLSQIYQQTHDNFYEDDHIEYTKTIWDILEGSPLEESIYNILPNLDIIPANVQFSNLPNLLIGMFPNDETSQYKYFEEKLAPLREMYDEIFIDVPPTIGTYSGCAMYFADYVILVLQTQVRSLRGAQTYIEYMKIFTQDHNTTLELVGIVPYMLQEKDKIDLETYDTAKELYGYHLLNTVVLYQARLKKYDADGITLQVHKNGRINRWDNKAHAIFLEIMYELEAHKAELIGDK